jgi:mannose-6-phosphate isomerase-like protein (cupin superfamily)
MRKQLSFRTGFHVAVTRGRFQAATMNLVPGGKEGGPANKHKGADQWLLVVEGTGKAIIAGRSQALKPGTLLLIEKNTTHEVRNTGKGLLKTVNLYSPPAYRKDGEPLPAGRAH